MHHHNGALRAVDRLCCVRRVLSWSTNMAIDATIMAGEPQRAYAAAIVDTVIEHAREPHDYFVVVFIQR